ncbi:YqaE/Pmp3 family membrane protein [Pseudemcibacter sp.]|uniref:YqaE/Pmp3 family membrane protein n=1 Tax=Pseudemcibacter sp. TaxID=2943293 RepID=UPI003F69B172|nr:YqaE/Pmp3 family membrane protein [Kordiimonadaceae bacterium]
MNKLLLILLCIFLPPVAVFIMRGISGAFILNIILVLLFFVPAIIHALWIAMSDKKIGK